MKSVNAAIPMSEVIAAPVENLWVDDYASQFCGIQTFEEHGGRYFALTTKELYLDKHSDFPQMGFTIERLDNSLMEPIPFVKIMRLEKTNELPRNYENKKYYIQRLRNKIARDSRRGLGNIILHNPHSDITRYTEDIGMKLIPFPFIKENVYVMLYKGVSKYDAPIFQITTEGKPTQYLFNPQYKSQMIKFEM